MLGLYNPYHNERFNINEKALEIGSAMYVQYALDFFKESF